MWINLIKMLILYPVLTNKMHSKTYCNCKYHNSNRITTYVRYIELYFPQFPHTYNVSCINHFPIYFCHTFIFLNFLQNSVNVAKYSETTHEVKLNVAIKPYQPQKPPKAYLQTTKILPWR